MSGDCITYIVREVQGDPGVPVLLPESFNAGADDFIVNGGTIAAVDLSLGDVTLILPAPTTACIALAEIEIYVAVAGSGQLTLTTSDASAIGSYASGALKTSKINDRFFLKVNNAGTQWLLRSFFSEF